MVATLPMFPLHRYQQLRQQLMVATLALGVTLLLGTIGYALLEQWSVVDALYMTVITLSTVGFSETHPLQPHTRIFTIALIFLGVLNVGFLINRFTEALTQSYFQDGLRLERQERVISQLQQHPIICGFGRTGHQVALEFAAQQIPFVVIDSSETAIAQALNLGYIALQGDATLDSTLLQAGIDRCRCLVVTLASDAENLYIVLSAKTLNPTVRTIARASTEEALHKLQRAGADVVISPYVTGAKRMAAAALRPQVTEFLDGILTTRNGSFTLEEFQIPLEGCPHIGQPLSLHTLLKKGALILAIGRADGTLVHNPTDPIQLEAGDTLICLGTAEQLHHLNQILMPIS